MSIYSGFATRQQQQNYDNLLLDLLTVLQKRIIKFYSNETADEARFHTILNNIYHHLAKMQQSKYLQPKLSYGIKQLVHFTTKLNERMNEMKDSQSQQNFNKIRINLQQQNSENAPVFIRKYSVPKESLSFTSQKQSADFKSFGVGKIKHQSYNDRDDISNPEFLINKNVKRVASTHLSRAKIVRPQVSNTFMENQQGINDQDKKNAQYIIREYVNKSKRKVKRRVPFD